MSVAKQINVSTHKSIVKSTKKHFSKEGQSNHHQKTVQNKLKFGALGHIIIFVSCKGLYQMGGKFNILVNYI